MFYVHFNINNNIFMLHVNKTRWLFLPMDAAWTASRLSWTKKWPDGVQPQKVVPGRRPWPSIHTLSTAILCVMYAVCVRAYVLAYIAYGK